MHNRIFNFVGYLGCHQRKDRSFHIRGYQLPMCARCTGVLIGQIFTLIILIVGIHLPLQVAIPLCISFMLVTFIDWLIQLRWHIESTNTRRLVTGIIGGIGLTGIYSIVGRYFYDLVF